MQEENKKIIEHSFSNILQALGVDTEDANFKETPARFAKSYAEIFRGLNADSDEELQGIFSKHFPANYNEMIVTKNVTAWSMCPHHFLPVRYEISFAYIPSNRVIGLSKVPRVIQLLAARPALQEQLTTDIVQIFEKYLQPKGCIVKVSGEHMCMQMRGVRATDSCVVTNAFTGCFENETSKAEFFRSL